MSKKELAIIGAGFIFLFGVVFYFTQCGDDGCGGGKKSPAVSTFRDCVEEGNPVMESFPRRCQRDDGTVVTEPLEGTGDDNKAGSAITVFEPTDGSSIGLPLTLRGRASVYGDALHYRLLDTDGSVLVDGSANVAKDGAFGASISYKDPFGDKGTLEVFESSPQGRSADVRVAIPLHFAETPTQMVYPQFLSLKVDPDRIACDQTAPFPRRVPADAPPERSAILELLSGPNEDDKKNGAQTSLPPDIELRGFTLVDGVATVDLSANATTGVKGSCRTKSFMAEINHTLLQFPTVKVIHILVDGKPVAL